MKIEVTNSETSMYRRQALSYLRWYPAKWRERYGEEFVAHLEDELEEQPVSYGRGLNIVLHGVTTRFRLDRGFRWTTSVALAVAMVAALVIGVLASEVNYAALPLSMHNEGGAGMPTRPKTVNNFNFRFTNRSSVRIRLLHVSLIGYKDYPVPRLVRVDVDVHHQKELGVDLPSTTPGLVPAIGRSVVLGNDDSIVASMVAPLKGHLYGVEGLTLQYVRKGVTHTVTTPLNKEPDLLCVEPRSSESLTSTYCTRRFTTVYALWSFNHSKTPGQTPAQSEALATVNAALSYVGGFADLRTAGVSDVREWTTRLFAHRGSWKITHVTATTENVNLLDVKHELVFHFDLVKRGTSERSIVCVRNGAYVRHGAYDLMYSPGLEACPKP